MKRSLLPSLGTPRFGRNEGRPGRNRHQRRKRWSRIACKYPLLYKHVLRETRRLSALPLLILLLHFYLSALYITPYCLLHIHPKYHQPAQPTTINRVKCVSKLILPLLSRMMNVLSVPSLHPLDTESGIVPIFPDCYNHFHPWSTCTRPSKAPHSPSPSIFSSTNGNQIHRPKLALILAGN